MKSDAQIIEAGMRIRNLREFCTLTNIEYKDSTNSRKAALKQLSRYYTWEKDGHAFVITSVKEVPDPKPLHGNDLFTEDVRIILEAFFSGVPGSVMFSKRELARVCGFVNPAYGTRLQPNFQHLVQSGKFTAPMIRFYLDKTSDLINGYCITHMTASIERLEQRDLISVDREVYVREEIETYVTPCDGGDEYETVVDLWRSATDREARVHRALFDKFKEINGLTYVNSVSMREYDRFRAKVYDKLGISESREYLRIKYVGASTFDDSSTANNAYLAAKRRINDKVLAHCLSKVPEQVRASFDRFLENYGKDPDTGLFAPGTTVVTMHNEEEEEAARNEVINRLIGFKGDGQSLREAREHSQLLQDLDLVNLPEGCSEEERRETMENVAHLIAQNNEDERMKKKRGSILK